LRFLDTPPGTVGFQITGHANGDTWRDMVVIYNARTSEVHVPVAGEWTIAAMGDEIREEGLTIMRDALAVPRLSMMIAFRR